MAAAFVLGRDLMRTFGLNSAEFYEAMCEPREGPWIPNGALPREPREPKADDGVWVCADNDEAARGAFGEWLGHLEAGE
jgi:hypothetical protein